MGCWRFDYVCAPANGASKVDERAARRVTRLFALLRLAHLRPFAVGGTRRCYVHPEDATLCVKVLRPDRTAAARLADAKGWRKLKGRRGFDDQRKELKAYRELRARGQADWTHVPRCYGAIETDQGVGVVSDLRRNWDGGYPSNLEQLLPNGMTPALRAAIAEFKAWLLRDLFLTRDLLPHNIIAVAGSPSRYHLVIVDGVGNSELVPVSNWLKTCARSKVERKLRKFDYRVRILLPGGAACDGSNTGS